MRIDITREASNKLSKKVFSFDLSDYLGRLRIVLDKYIEQSKATTRKHYKKDKIWERTLQRHNDFTDEEIRDILSISVVKEAKERFKQEIDKLAISL